LNKTYKDYSNNISLKICYTLDRLRLIPVRGLERITNLLIKILPKPTPDGFCIIKTLDGYKILINPVLDKGVERTIFHHGTYELGTLIFLKEFLSSGDTFIDIGANIGLMSLHASKIVGDNGKVISFEPLPSTYEVLNKNIEINKCNNIVAEKFAIGSKNEFANFYDNLTINRGSASFFRRDDEKSCHKITIKRLDDYLEENRFNRFVNCIKIDVEGWELEVLKGAKTLLSSKKAPACIIEYSKSHPTFGGKTQEIFTFFRSINKYRIFCLKLGKGTPSKLDMVQDINYLPYHDNLFCLLPEHIKRLPKTAFTNKSILS